MTRRRLVALLIASVVSVCAPPLLSHAAEPPASFAGLVEKLSPAVVNISTTQKVKAGAGVQFFGTLPDDPQLEPFRDFLERFGSMPQGGAGGAPEREVTSLGSGFVIDASGYIITNNHVIDAAEEITVTFPDNAKHKAKIIGRDPKTDLALLKIEAGKPLPFVPVGDSDKMRVGDWVVAIGNPYGLGGSVTQGIISARQRSINAGPFDDFLQTDAPINRGNSGGPLFNMSGEVIGINSAIFSPSGGNIGIGFAIPSNLAMPVVEQLKKFGRTHRGWLGVKIQEVSDEVADSMGLPKPVGALVAEVTPKSPAGKAGVQAGDVITKFDGREITEMRFLPRMVAEAKIGSTVPLEVWRKGKRITANVKVEELDEKEGDEKMTPPDDTKPMGKVKPETFMGMEIAPIIPSMREQYKLDHALDGLIVLEVTPGSEAAKRGITPGTVIIDAGGGVINSAADLEAAVAQAKKAGRKNVLLKVSRRGEVLFVPLPVGGK